MDKLQEYADVILTSGVNLKKGQKLNIACSYGSYGFARLLGERAYDQGAGFVNIEIRDNYLARARAANQEGAQLEYFPLFSQVQSAQCVSEEWAYISIDNTDESHVLKDADADKIQTMTKTSRKGRDILLTSLMKDKIPWNIVAFPNETWAKEVLGDDATAEELWKVLKPILRLDQNDPVAAWREHSETLRRRCRKLEEMKIDSLRFTDGDGTDLYLGIPKGSKWEGGGALLPDGRAFMPNIPTEEVFTTPDRLRTEGFVKVRKPLQVLETRVEGAWFRFKAGKVVEFGAEVGEEILGKFLAIDEGATMLGEIALVDGSSKIAESGKLFGSILFDENASSHMALGFGFPGSVPGGDAMTEDELRDAGCNTSMVHIDFMIGWEKTNVTAMDKSGKEITIMKDGTFVI
ncbi:aminopeptidase [Spirochaeta isovalerica]|uniref:Aminopeptidase n=1 Tax=Spirochaeta isovalerica TaxID=150 RepID=A0A841RGR2_9SPIO|nr:aminopeptidase [Spirochaeta isovalerica]MBB6482397.1 aminopeptidase [Spirochaeta isovalerica]